jgi:hypothetical protein
VAELALERVAGREDLAEQDRRETHRTTDGWGTSNLPGWLASRQRTVWATATPRQPAPGPATPA